MTICELLLSNPLRANNICMLELAEGGRGHLYKLGSGFEIQFAKHEVKNPHKEKEEGYRAKVNSRAAAWLNFYITEVLPTWPTKPGAANLLFRSDSGYPLTVNDLLKIMRSVSKRCLPEYEPIGSHMWRHIIATGWLKAHPNDYVTVALILGDRIETVLREYAHLASEDGLKRYHAMLGPGSRRSVPTKDALGKGSGTK